MSHLLAPMLAIADAITATMQDANGVVVVTHDPERANNALASDADAVILVGVPDLDWTTYTAHDATVPVHLISATRDYSRSLHVLDHLVDAIAADADLSPARVRPARYEAAPRTVYPAVTLTIIQPRD